MDHTSSFSNRQVFVAQACYFVLGAGVLGSWNALITATDYFQALYPGWHMDRLFTICYLPTCLVWLGVMIRFPRLMSHRARIMLGYSGFAVVMAGVPLMDLLVVAGQQRAPVGALAVLLASVCLVGIFDGLCQGAIFGETAQMPPRFTHAVVSGTASSGLLICLLRIATKALTPADDGPAAGPPAAPSPPPLQLRDGAAAAVLAAGGSGNAGDALLGMSGAEQHALRVSTQLYFWMACLLSLSCLAVYEWVLPGLPLVGHYRAQAAGLEPVQACETDPLLGPEPPPGAVTGSGLQLEMEMSASADGSQHAACHYANSNAAASQPTAALPLDADAEAGAHERQPLVAAGGLQRGEKRGHRQQRPASAALAGAAKSGMVSERLLDAADSPAGQRQAGAALAAPAAAVAAGSGDPLDTVEGAAAATPLARCLQRVWPLCVCLVVTYAVTLSIFPGFLAEDVHSAELGDWYPILLITAFNAADLVGKSLPRLTPTVPGQPGARGALEELGRLRRCGGCLLRLLRAPLAPLRSAHGLMWASGLRGVVFVPAFIASAELQAPAAVMAALTAALGVSNGYLTVQAMLLAPLMDQLAERSQAAKLGGCTRRDADARGGGAWGSGGGNGDEGTDAEWGEWGDGWEGSVLLPGEDEGPKPAPGSGSGACAGATGGQQQHQLQHSAEADVSENLVVFSLVGGLNIGAYLGWLWLLRT